jgi:mannan endo-1,6-alpha-mannosidase
MVEVACETQVPPTCNTDMLSFKAYLARWMAAATKVAPFIHDKVMTALTTSAKAAALQCSGSSTGRACGLQWTKGATWDGTTGVGQEMAALEVIQSTQIDNTNPPVTNSTGGTSIGNNNAGSESGGSTNPLMDNPTTTGDKAGAGILTAILLVGMVGGLGWMVVE